MEEGLLGGFAQGIRGAIQGIYDAEDRDFKRKEMAARLAAAKTEEQRKFDDQDIEAAKAGFRVEREESGRVRGLIRDPNLGKQPTPEDLEMRDIRIENMRSSIDSRRAADDLRQSEAQRRREKELDDKAQALSGKLQNGGELNSAITSIERELGFNLDDFDEKTGSIAVQDPQSGAVTSKKVDLPGVSVPGIGRVTAYNSSARGLESKIAKIFNVELKDRSGAAVTHPELDRLKAEFASGKFNTEAEMLGALKQYKAAFADAVRNIEAGFDPEAAGLISQRGGFTSQSISRGGLLQKKQGLVKGAAPTPKAGAQQAQSAGGFPRQVRNAKTGKVATVSNAAELKEANAEGFE